MLETKMKISGFCDEIHDDIIVQFEAAKKLGIKYFDPRIVDGKNVTLLTDDELDRLCALMKEYGMPHCAADVGVDMTEETFNEYYERICNSSAINKNNKAECERLKESLKYFWSIG